MSFIGGEFNSFARWLPPAELRQASGPPPASAPRSAFRFHHAKAIGLSQFRRSYSSVVRAPLCSAICRATASTATRRSADFEQDFLYQDTESYIWGIYLLPWNWTWLTDPTVGTNDFMDHVYDRTMFHGATFRDLAKLGRPVIAVGATDLAYGNPMVFTQETFDLICSDLDDFPVARAVAASNGFPGLFSPITLTNRRRTAADASPAGCATSAKPTGAIRCPVSVSRRRSWTGIWIPRRSATCTWSMAACRTTSHCVPAGR